SFFTFVLSRRPPSSTFFPYTTLFRSQEKFAVDGIAKREAASFRVAGDRVEKKLLALVRVLKPPRFAAVGRLVNARLFAFSAGHQIGHLLVERHDPEKVERVANGDLESLPRLTLVDGSQNHAIRTRCPNHRPRNALGIRHFGHADSAEVGVDPAGLHFPPLRLHACARQ